MWEMCDVARAEGTRKPRSYFCFPPTSRVTPRRAFKNLLIEIIRRYEIFKNYKKYVLAQRRDKRVLVLV